MQTRSPSNSFAWETFISVRWTEAVWLRGPDNVTDRIVLLAIADHANRDTGHCFPGIQTLSNMTTLSTRAVISSVQRMVKKGYIHSERGNRRKGQANTYQLDEKMLGLGEPSSYEAGSCEGRSCEAGALLGEADDVIKCISRHRNKEEPLLTVIEPITRRKLRATRVPTNFSVTESHRQFAIDNHLPIPETQLGAFIDYWTAKSGRDATKQDWDATFRNWLRNSTKFGNNGNGHSRSTVTSGKPLVTLTERTKMLRDQG